MSELKAIELGDAYKLYFDDKEFYLKSEADKVIADCGEWEDRNKETTNGL